MTAIGRCWFSPIRLFLSWTFGVSLWVVANPKGYGQPLLPTGISSTSGAPVNAVYTTDKLTVIQSGPLNARTIINWGTWGSSTTGFDIGSGNSVEFVQPGTHSAILNRDITGNPSQILGAIQANGEVYLINTAGITIGNGAVINAFSFGASTFDVNDNDFLNGFPSGHVLLTQTAPGVSLSVNGSSITASNQGGHVVLVSNNIRIGTSTLTGTYVGLAAANGSVDINLVGTTPIVQGLYGDTHITIGQPGGEVHIVNSDVTASNGLSIGGQIDIATGIAKIEHSNLAANGTLAGGNINIFANSSPSTNQGKSVLINGGSQLSVASSSGQGGTIAIFSQNQYLSAASTQWDALGGSSTLDGEIFIEQANVRLKPIVNGAYTPAPIIFQP
ncbi:two-partner secretion domain-containing protein [Candidatus Methylacidithermus pantelleriae]|uniref:Filamentous haemagglutinin FhaB/tRNA nuclease CdiA-like TPS domain-containing protein n=1 Tax=Candidatus Methylacidithermus pantelleriae TaxID=2744239 RepID=A0A8J2BMS5_9BACT|nr:filamentous hemagglutinin N-terminal domain-containing protein [Candidatus Methylacidithermus pantelleriae]CAF0689967.1 hypothetical protein MPNT_10457 [Candidatus Methylacidithermus pantelleriae]